MYYQADKGTKPHNTLKTLKTALWVLTIGVAIIILFKLKYCTDLVVLGH